MNGIVVDIGGSGTRIGVVTGKGVAGVQRENLSSVEELAGAILARSGGGRIDGIALSVPGFVRARTGEVTMSTVAPWLEGNLGSTLKTRFPQAGIFVVNDGEAHALALLDDPGLQLGAINVAIGTGVGFGMLDSAGKVVRTACGDNWDIGDMRISTRASNPAVWFALGQSGMEELMIREGDNALNRFSERLGSFLTQLAVIFRPRTIGLSGGYISRYWHEMERGIVREFASPVRLSTRIVAQKDSEPALTGLSVLLRREAGGY